MVLISEIIFSFCVTEKYRKVKDIWGAAFFPLNYK